MGHEIDLKRYQTRTDLAVEAVGKIKEQEKVEQHIEKVGDVVITDVVIKDQGGALIGKEDGRYITVEFQDITDHDNRENVKQIVATYMKKMLAEMKITDGQSCLVIGLGNRMSTPDALGPMVASSVMVTNHLFTYGEVEEGFRPVASFIPGVMGQTGLETTEIVSGLVKEIQPDFLIVVDALASQSVERVNQTIQMTNTGIHPGSGVLNHRKEMSEKTLGLPVLAIGVPTVVDAVTIVSDTLHYVEKHFSYMKKYIDDPIHKLAPLTYLKSVEEVELSRSEKENLFGLVGSLSKSEIKQLIFEVLTPVGYNLIVTPKEVDFIMEHLTEIIKGAIDVSLHQKVTD